MLKTVCFNHINKRGNQCPLLHYKPKISPITGKVSDKAFCVGFLYHFKAFTSAATLLSDSDYYQFQAVSPPFIFIVFLTIS